MTWIRFLPAFLVLPCWLAIGLQEDMLSVSYQEFWPLAVAMVFGSMIAGSTPLGGGVVAFPVAVLIIGFKPAQGRDFSLMIQSVGMTGASYLVLVKKAKNLAPYGDLIAASCFFSVVGLVVGLQFKMSPFLVNIVYTTCVASFAIILAYFSGDFSSCIGRGEAEDAVDKPQEQAPKESAQVESGDESWTDDMDQEQASPKDLIKWISIAILCFGGGVISSQIGTGADIAFFVYGTMIHNRNKSDASSLIEGNDLTAMSIIVMACTSIFGTVMRVATQKNPELRVDIEVYQALIACSCIVIVGAPLGSLFLTPKMQSLLKKMFYILSFLQLASFGILKVKNDVVVWAIIVGVLLSVCLGLAVFDRMLRRMQTIRPV